MEKFATASPWELSLEPAQVTAAQANYIQSRDFTILCLQVVDLVVKEK